MHPREAPTREHQLLVIDIEEGAARPAHFAFVAQRVGFEGFPAQTFALVKQEQKDQPDANAGGEMTDFGPGRGGSAGACRSVGVQREHQQAQRRDDLQEQTHDRDALSALLRFGCRLRCRGHHAAALSVIFGRGIWPIYAVGRPWFGFGKTRSSCIGPCRPAFHFMCGPAPHLFRRGRGPSLHSSNRPAVAAYSSPAEPDFGPNRTGDGGRAGFTEPSRPTGRRPCPASDSQVGHARQRE